MLCTHPLSDGSSTTVTGHRCDTDTCGALTLACEPELSAFEAFGSLGDTGLIHDGDVWFHDESSPNFLHLMPKFRILLSVTISFCIWAK